MNETERTDLVGMSVIEQHGREIGTIKKVLVDVANWHVARLVIKLHRDVLADLRLNRPLLGTQTICVGTDQVSCADDILVLHMPLEELAATSGVHGQSGLELTGTHREAFVAMPLPGR